MPDILRFHTDLKQKKSNEPSSIYSLLPHLVQELLPRLPTVKNFIFASHSSGEYRSEELQPRNNNKREKSGFGSMSKISSKKSVPSGQKTQDGTPGSLIDAQCRGEEQSGDSIGLGVARASENEIVWNVAQKGLKLLNLAIDESATQTVASTCLARQLYLNSLTYLIHALPSDLTQDEQTTICAALPENIITTLNLNPSKKPKKPAITSKIQPTSLLRRTLAFIIVQFFLFVQVMLPYVQVLLVNMWKYERENQIIMKLIGNCVEIAMSVGRAMRRFSDGKICLIIAGFIQWFMEGLIGGIGEGIFAVGTIGREKLRGAIKARVN